jgi:hypothetical protein
MQRQRLLTLVVLGLAFAVVSTLREATSKRLHVTIQIAPLTFTGDPDSPQLGDRSIGNADLFDESGASVGTAVSSYTIISVPPLGTRDEYLLTAVLAEGQIIYGGVAPTAAIVRVVEVRTKVQWGILGGTGDFRTARGDVTAIVTAPGIFDITGGQSGTLEDRGRRLRREHVADLGGECPAAPTEGGAPGIVIWAQGAVLRGRLAWGRREI